MLEIKETSFIKKCGVELEYIHVGMPKQHFELSCPGVFGVAIGLSVLRESNVGRISFYTYM